MFNNDEPPVSLFSFQDIITSLTGIMIFFLLLLSLNILDLMKRNQESSPTYKELEEIKGKNRILQAQVDDISSDIRSYRKRIQIAQTKDESALTIERYQLEKKINDLKFQKGDFDKKLKDEKEKYSSFEEENKKLKHQLNELEQKDKKLKNMAAEIEQKKKQISEIRKAIEKRRKDIQVMIDSSINKIPVLIDLSSDKICVYNPQEKTKKFFHRKDQMLAELISDAISHLQLFSKDKYYFVFMVRPSAADYLEDFLRCFKNEIKNPSYGTEPILEHEGVTDE